MIDNVCLDEVLLAGAKEVFETMIFMNLEKSSDPEQHISSDAILGSITFKGCMEGCLTICCSISCAKSIAVNMLGMDPSEDLNKEDICDAIGEVTNMVMGSVKSKMNETNLDVSIPTVISGKELGSSLGDDAKKISIKTSIDDEYAVEFSLLYRNKKN